MSMTDIFAADVQATEADMPCSFVWNGKPFTGQRNEIADSLEMADAGLIQKYRFDLIARAAIFGSKAPEKDDLFQITDATGQPISYRIDQVTPSQDGVTIRFSMVQDN